MHVKTVKTIFSSRYDKPCKLYTHAEICLEFCKESVLVTFNSGCRETKLGFLFRTLCWVWKVLISQLDTHISGKLSASILKYRTLKVAAACFLEFFMSIFRLHDVANFR